MTAQARPRGRSTLRSDVAFYGAAIGIDRLFGFALLPLLTAAMDRTDFGAWNQVITAFALASNLLQVGFYHSIVRYVPGQDRATIGRVLNGILTIILVNCALFVGLALLFPNVLSRILFGQPEIGSVVVSAAVFIVTECLFEFLVLGFLRADGRIRLCSAYSIVKSALKLLLLWQGTLAGAGLAGLLQLLAIGNSILVVGIYIAHVLPTAPAAIKAPECGFWRGAIRYSSGIVLSANLSWANVSLNRFLIIYLLGLGPLGIYAANYSIASLVNIVALIVNFTVVPRLNEAWNQGNKARVRDLLGTVTRYYCFVTVPMAVGIGVFYLPIMRLFTTPAYVAPMPLICWLLVFMVLLGLEQLTTFASFLDNSRFSVFARSASLALNVAICLLLLNSFGIAAAAFAAVVSVITVIAFNYLFLRRLTSYEFPWRGAASILAAGAAMGLFAHSVFWLLPSQSFGAAFAVGFVTLPVYVCVEAVWPGSVGRQLLGLLQHWRHKAV